jgi:RNA polymerase sigma-70 factor (ECF subfamily)
LSRVEDVLLVLRAQSGDREALDALLRQMQGPLFRCIRGIVGHRELAEDVLQEVFVILCHKLVWLREPRLFRAWSYRIASREALRRLKRERRLGAPADEGALALLPDPQVPDPVRRELAARLPALVTRVAPACRPVLALHYLEELTLPAVADILGLPLGTVKSRLAYGLRQLRGRLGVVPAERHGATNPPTKE